MSKKKTGAGVKPKPEKKAKDLAALCAAEERAYAASKIGSQMERVAAFETLQALVAELRARKEKPKAEAAQATAAASAA
jgi:putative heme degradation protein